MRRRGKFDRSRRTRRGISRIFRCEITRAKTQSQLPVACSPLFLPVQNHGFMGQRLLIQIREHRRGHSRHLPYGNIVYHHIAQQCIGRHFRILPGKINAKHIISVSLRRVDCPEFLVFRIPKPLPHRHQFHRFRILGIADRHAQGIQAFETIGHKPERDLISLPLAHPQCRTEIPIPIPTFRFVVEQDKGRTRMRPAIFIDVIGLSRKHAVISIFIGHCRTIGNQAIVRQRLEAFPPRQSVIFRTTGTEIYRRAPIRLVLAFHRPDIGHIPGQRDQTVHRAFQS